MAKKERADQLLYMSGQAESREQAKRLIMAGGVFICRFGVSVRVEKPGHPFPDTTEFEVKGKEPFVSRGAYKLITALDHFSLDVAGMVVLDAGASTGGFTDCLLQRGATRVYAVDVGRNQLHERLQSDPRVVNLEGVNLRIAHTGLIPELLDMVVSDVSFISLSLILGPCMQWLKPGGKVAALIKPQFELGPGATIKGVVRDQRLRDAAVDKILGYAKEELSLALLGVVPSAIKGPKGNQEYMAVWQKPLG